MILGQFPLLADENINPAVVESLRTAGSDVLAIQEHTALVGSADQAIVQVSIAQRRVSLTHGSDCGSLAFSGEPALVGLIFLRPGHINPRFTIESIRALFAQVAQIRPPFLIVAHRKADRLRVRVRDL